MLALDLIPLISGGRKQDHDTGRDRAAFFFWQGSDCSIKEKGKSAFLTVRVDSERAPQVKIVIFSTLFCSQRILLQRAVCPYSYIFKVSCIFCLRYFLFSSQITSVHSSSLVSDPLTQAHSSSLVSDPLTQYHSSSLVSDPLTQYHSSSFVSDPLTQAHSSSLVSDPLTQYHSSSFVSDPFDPSSRTTSFPPNLPRSHGYLQGKGNVEIENTGTEPHLLYFLLLHKKYANFPSFKPYFG